MLRFRLDGFNMNTTSYCDSIKNSWKFLATWLLVWVTLILTRVKIPDFAMLADWDMPIEEQQMLHSILNLSSCFLGMAALYKLLKIWFNHLDNRPEDNEGLYFIETLASNLSKSSKAWMLVIIPWLLLYISYLVRNDHITHSFFIAGAISFAFAFLHLLRDARQSVRTTFLVLFLLVAYPIF